MGRIARTSNKTMIAELREKMGWSQEFVAGNVGCTREYINLLENRKKKNPSAIIVKKLAYLYGTTTDKILKDLGF